MTRRGWERSQPLSFYSNYFAFGMPFMVAGSTGMDTCSWAMSQCPLIFLYRIGDTHRHLHLLAFLVGQVSLLNAVTAGDVASGGNVKVGDADVSLVRDTWRRCPASPCDTHLAPAYCSGAIMSKAIMALVGDVVRHDGVASHLGLECRRKASSPAP